MKRFLSSTALSLSIFAITSAFAADGYVTGDVNLRAGPDISYPRVSMLDAGTPVAIEGCVNGWSWCDVAAGDNRGWVAGNFLQEEYQGQRVFVPEYGVQIGIPIVAFVFGAYWDEHYRNRSWYSEREHWSQVRPQYRSVIVHGDRDGREHGNSYENSRGADANDARAASAHGDRAAGETERAGVTPTQPAQHGRSSTALVPQHATATSVHSPDRTVNHSTVAQHGAAESTHGMPRTVTQHEVAQSKATPQHGPTQPRTVAQQRVTVQSKAQQKVTPEKSPPKQESDKDKNNQH